MYNRYIGNTGKFYRVEDDAPPAFQQSQAYRPQTPPGAYPQPQRETYPRESYPREPQGSPRNPPQADGHGRSQGFLSGILGSIFPNNDGHGKGQGFLSGILGSILPKGLDTGDILLFVLLLLLYNESKDEELLIILAALFLLK